MGDILITSTEGGLSFKSPSSLFENQCTSASNVQWVTAKCGERRKGATNRCVKHAQIQSPPLTTSRNQRRDIIRAAGARDKSETASVDRLR